jgi:hypothetical protein
MLRNYLFFEVSRETFDHITSLFDFLWPTAAAMWNLRWQVNGYLSVRPDANVYELNNRFVAGSGIHGANLKRACVDFSWEEQQMKFANFLLINIFAIYESYLKKILSDLTMAGNNLEKKLQFPTSIDANWNKKGIWGAIDEITANESQMLKRGFYQRLLSHKKNAKNNLDNLMRCYRYFKECRNSLAHNGGIATKRLEEACTEFSTVATTTALGVKEVPLHQSATEGDPVHLNIRGVVGFCGIILNIIVTLDAEFSRSHSSEIVFENYWKNKHGNRYTLKTNDEKRKHNQVKYLINRLGLPQPENPEVFEIFLRQRRLVN